MEVDYMWRPGDWVRKNSELMDKCAELYSNHYGHWSQKAPISPGNKIKLSPNRIAEWLSSDDSKLATARLNNELIGYAIAIQEKVPYYGFISWVTQLVVHKTYRRKDIGKNLLFHIWTLSDHFAWGVLSSTPYAIRALEKATRRRCVPKRIKKHMGMLISFGSKNISYVSKDMKVEITDVASSCDTNFFSDHSKVDERINKVSSNSTPWLLGPLKEGWEWFAFTFRDQDQLNLTQEEIDKMLYVSDKVTRKAYSRMNLDSSHLWTKHTSDEANSIFKFCNLQEGNTVLDLGCGKGRHSIELAKRGIQVTGIDYIDSLIQWADKESNALLKKNRPLFVVDDARYTKLNIEFDAVICLYDIVGTFLDNSENKKILKNIFYHLKHGGKALISVMNYELTEFKAKHFFSLKNQPNTLLDIAPSQTMEKTGDIFNPDYYLVDKETCIVYRKEQFLLGSSLPDELIIRDRRFRKDEIEEMCNSAGLNVIWSKYVNAGKWDTSLSPTDDKSKEILLLCEKSLI